MTPALYSTLTESLFPDTTLFRSLFTALDVVPELVEARAGGRQQHAIAALRDCTRALQRAAHVRFAPDRHSAADVAFDLNCIFPEQHRSASLAGQRFAQFDERLPLALAATRSEEQTSEIQSLLRISYAVF